MNNIDSIVQNALQHDVQYIYSLVLNNYKHANIQSLKMSNKYFTIINTNTISAEINTSQLHINNKQLKTSTH